MGALLAVPIEKNNDEKFSNNQSIFKRRWKHKSKISREIIKIHEQSMGNWLDHTQESIAQRPKQSIHFQFECGQICNITQK